MGFRLGRIVSFTGSTTPPQQFDADLILPRDNRVVFHATIRDEQGNPLPCAVVKFFKVAENAQNPDPFTTCELEPIGHAITDDCGQVLLGPVEPNQAIVWKVFKLVNETAFQGPFVLDTGTCAGIDPPNSNTTNTPAGLYTQDPNN